MSTGEKRIFELTETQSFGADDYLALDNINNTEAKKIKAKTVGKTYTIEDTEDGFTFEGDNGYSHNVHIPDVEIEEKTASGEIATFDDGVENISMKSVVCEINPVQDLHGYDHPWTGGAGKNKFDVSQVVNLALSNTVVRSDDYRGWYMPVKNGETYTISRVNTSQPNRFRICFTLEEPQYGVSIYNQEGVIETYIDAGSLTEQTVTVPSDKEYKYMFLYLSNANETITEDMKIQVEKGSFATTYEPYSNICPISGHTEANVVVSPTTDAEDGTTYTIQFKDGSNPLTVYGGSLDAISGKLTVDRVSVVLDGTEAWGKDNDLSGYHRFYVGNNYIKKLENYKGHIVSNACETVNNYAFFAGFSGEMAVTAYSIITSQNNYLYLISKSLSSETDVKAYLASNPLQVVYDLATPITYQLTPTQVKSLLGTNNVWHDCNGGISIIYLKGNLGGYVYGLDKQIENVDAKVENIKTELGTAELQTTDKTIKGAINELDARDKATVSDKYNNETGTYAVGDTAIYENELYVCNTPIPTPEDFDSTKWDKMTLGEYCAEIKSNLTEKTKDIATATIASTATTKYTSAGDGWRIAMRNGIVSLDLVIDVKSAQSGWTDVGQIPSDFPYPPQTLYFPCNTWSTISNTKLDLQITAGGVIKMRNGAVTQYYVHLSW